MNIKKDALQIISYDKNLRSGSSWFRQGLSLYAAGEKLRSSHPIEASLLTSYGFELILKSYWVTENKKGGLNLPKELETHNLNFLKSKISTLSKNKKLNSIFQNMENFIIWSGRYLYLKNLQI